MSKSMLNPPEREKYNKGKLVKNATKALFDFFGEDASEKQIKSKMEAVHTAVEKAPIGPKKADTLKQVAIDQDLTLQNVKDIEKLYAYKSGGGGKENIFGEVKQVFKALTTKGTSGQLDAEEFGGARTTREARKKAGEAFIGGSLLTGASIAGVTAAWNALNSSPPTPSEASEFEKAFSKAHNAGKNTFMFKNKEYTTNVRKGKAKGGELGDDDYDYEEYRRRFLEETLQDRREQEEREKERREENERRTAETLQEKMTEGEKRAIAEEKMRLNDEAAERYYEDKNRLGFNEGSLMVPTEGLPVDTYDNIPPEEMDEAMASQLPDDKMEDDYFSYVMDESLDDDEQMYLAGVLQDDPKLSDIMDKVITTASEFSGAGEVDGPGTGVSDSIPARLSDGEFVITKKATDQIGADNLQVMMDDAERAYDGGYQMKAIGGYMLNKPNQETTPMNTTEEEIRKLMMGANKMPSL